MRDLRTRLTRSRRSRRIALAILILTAYPAAAEQPQGHQLRMLPPLPLKSISGGTLHSNPFCEPENLSGTGAILLASGNGSIRLKPVQGEVGFYSIQESGLDVSPPTATMEPIAAPLVPHNPLIKSIHHDNNDLVETDFAAACEVIDDQAAAIVRAPNYTIRDAESEPRRSSIILIPPVKTCTESCAASQLEESIRILAPAPTIRKSSPIPDPVRPSAEVVSSPDSLSITSEPIVFSLSDRPAANSDSNAAVPMENQALDVEEKSQDQLSAEFQQRRNADEAETNAIEPLVLGIDSLETPELHDGELVELDSYPELAQPLTHAQESAEASSPSADQTIDVADVEPVVLDRLETQPHLSDVPRTQIPAPVSIQRSQSSVLAADKPSDRSLHSQRYRPPVAVTPVPITFHRGENRIEVAEAETAATIQRVEEMELAASMPKALLAPHIKLTPLYMKSAQVRSLTVAGELRDVQVADKRVCQAVPAGPNQLKLIGTGDGVTQLVVWAQTDDPKKPMRMRAFEIHVDRVDPAVEAGGSTAKLLNQSIRNAFPHCDVVLSQEGGELIVSGRCDSDQSAEKIIRMIRKTCLVPVQDRLVVR